MTTRHGVLRIRRNQVISFLLAIAIGGGGGFAVLKWRSIQQRVQPIVTEVPPQPSTVVALGRIEPEGQVTHVAGIPGERIKQLLVVEGAMIQQNQVVAYLDAYDERLAERNYAKSQLIEARNRLRAETAFGETQIREAQTRLQQVSQPQTLEIEAQQNVIAQTQAQLELAQINLQRYQTLYQEGAVPRMQLDERITQVREKQEELNRSQIVMSQLASTRQTNLANAIAQRRSAQANMRRSQLQTQIETTARNLQLAESRLARTIIRAPRTGQILNVLTRAGETIGESGILQMGDTRQMYVMAEVDEANIRLVRVEQRVLVRDRNGVLEKPLTGTVWQIGQQVFKNQVLDNSPTANVDARVVKVRIRLDQSKPVADLTNLQVDAEILTGTTQR